MDWKQFHSQMEEIILNVLKKEGLLVKPYHHGIVDSVISPTKLKVFVDGSDVSQTISCNPDITFEKGDHVWVVYINNSPRDKFVISKRAIQ